MPQKPVGWAARGSTDVGVSIGLGPSRRGFDPPFFQASASADDCRLRSAKHPEPFWKESGRSSHNDPSGAKEAPKTGAHAGCFASVCAGGGWGRGRNGLGRMTRAVSVQEVITHLSSWGPWAAGAASYPVPDDHCQHRRPPARSGRSCRPNFQQTYPGTGTPRMSLGCLLVPSLTSGLV